MIDGQNNIVFLAPMAGVTDRAYREIAVGFGAGMTFTEMVSAKGLYYNDRKTKSLLEAGDSDVPCAAQIFGHEPDVIAKAAKDALSYGAKFLDINCGCPTPKITRNGDGAALLKDPETLGAVVKSAVDWAGAPVSVKIRKGWDDNRVNAVEIAKIAEKNGACMITVHGRTALQQYGGKADWEIIKKVVGSVGIPVVGNGDIFRAEDAKHMLEVTGCAAVMLGRGTLGNPWLIRDTVSLLTEGRLPPPPSVEEKIRLAIAHIKRIVRYKGEYLGIREARKHALWYIKGMRGSAAQKLLISKAQSLEELERLLMFLCV
jgi:tRNA-dihydrouridine synthase B